MTLHEEGIGARAALAMILVAGSQSIAADQAAEELSTRLKDNVSRDVGPTQPAHALLKKTVTDTHGARVGELVDMIVDPYAAMVATAVVRPGESVDRDYRLLVPFPLLTPINFGVLQTNGVAKSKLADGPAIGRGVVARPYTRQLAVVPYKFHGLTPYWKGPQAKQSKPGKATQQQRFRDHDQLRYLTQLHGLPITRSDGTRLGQLQDLVISTANGKIAYAVLFDQRDTDGPDGGRYAIPLGAFVADEPTKNWVIELPDKLIDSTPPIGDDKWPAKISIGWENYVEQRYGGHALDGVQRTLRTHDSEED